MRIIADKYIRKVNKGYARNYPALACFSGDYISTRIFLDGRYEIKELDFLASKVFPKLKQRSACLDIGANIGNHALYFADYFDKVIAIEPHPRTFRLLEINAELVDNVVPVNKGCSNAKRRVVALEPLMNIGGTRIAEDNPFSPKQKFKRVEFDLELLDDMKGVNDCLSIDFIKIDIEDHELECYRGAVNLLNKHQPVIACEVGSSSISDGKSPTIEHLKHNNYRFIYELRKAWTGGDHFDLALTERLTHKHHNMVICSQYSLA